MGGRMNWRLAAKSGRRTQDLRDERENEGRDKAARWLETAEAARGNNKPNKQAGK